MKSVHRTPPRSLIATRSMKHKQQDGADSHENAATTEQNISEPNKCFDTDSIRVKPVSDSGLNKTDIIKSVSKSRRAKSSSSSLLARRKQLELEAAEAKGRIQMDLIDKRLAAEIAELENEEYSSQSGSTEIHSKNAEVEKWLSNSQLELEAQPGPLDGLNRAKPCVRPPPSSLQPPRQVATTDGGATEGTVHLLATALKDLTAATTANGSNANMLSRLCMPKDLPYFSGDPMEWLQFKQAYEESTTLCNFNGKENLWRLRKCLQGAAKEAVAALLITASSPETVMSTLELQFGNPDVIISRIMNDVKKLHPVSQEYHRDIVTFAVKVKNFVAAVLSVGQDEYLKGMSVMSTILSKLPAVLISKWTDYSYPIINSSDKPKLVILSEFLSEEATKISKTSVNITYSSNEYKRKQSNYTTNRVQTVLVQNDNSNYEHKKCRFCHLFNHEIVDCKKFKRALRKNRWQFVKRNGLCYRCLVSRHNKDMCPAPACDINNCAQPHHRLLHFASTNNTDRETTSTLNTQTETEPPREETVTHIQTNSNYCKVLLKTVPICVYGPKGKINSVALLDDGSTVSLISESLASRVGLRGTRQSMRVRGAWNNSELLCESEIVQFKISNVQGTIYTLRARSTKGLNLPTQNIPVDILQCNELLKNIQDNFCYGQCKPELLIGQDNYQLLIPLQIIHEKPTDPYLTHTPLGWCLHGLWAPPPSPPSRAAVFAKPASHAVMLLTECQEEEEQESSRILYELQEEVRRSFTVESMGISSKPRQNSDDVRAIEHLERTSTLKDGRWHVGLPWKDVNCKIPNSYTNAERRLRGVEKKMKLSQGYKERYTDRINHLLENNYARELPNPKVTPRTWYLPHFGVDNPYKQKLRLVFDCAAKNNGFSLNDYLLTGPDLLMSLYGIMLRFREQRVAVMGDIRDMFMRIKILPEDQDSFRFLWRYSPEQSIKTYAMSSLVFGANCSPFIAQFIKNKNAKCYESSKPSAVYAICKQHYMDDYIDSIHSDESAVQLIKDIIYIHRQGGFEIRNFTSNSEVVINSLPKETLAPSAIKLRIGQRGNNERILGLIWYPEKDELGFDVSFKRIPLSITSELKRPTKREILRVVMSIFDVYGYLSPFTIKGKMLLQMTWRKNLLWDEEVPDHIYNKWLDWMSDLKLIESIRLPRCYQESRRVSAKENILCSNNNLHQSSSPPPPPPPPSPHSKSSDALINNNTCYRNLQLHIFCDASIQAMCAVAYWRWINDDANIQVAFISSKCRVAPVKPLSVPRLELQAALMGARLADSVTKEHRICVQQRYLWSDSSTVLHWVRNNNRTYKPYIAHRLGEIDELTQPNEWNYVPTKQNVADLATRDKCDISIFNGEWLYGPEFLYSDHMMWPSDLPPDVCCEDLDQVNCITTDVNLPSVPEPERFSSWLRLLKSTCVVLSFINKCKKLTGIIDGTMMEKAERLLILYSQSQSFLEDLKDPKSKKSRLLTLSPEIDEHGVLRVGGRISSAPGIPNEVKHPIILDGRNHIALLIVRYYHVKAAHGNRETVVNNLKQKYWIIGMRPAVKRVASRCMYCRIKKAQPQPPRMGDLPEARMAHHQRPFTYCGVDLFGPMEVTLGRRREKRYGVLFTCLTVRAIHIEIVSDLTTDVFIMALRRMAARRGWPKNLFSDNGTNLRGADNELKRSIQELDEESLKREAINYGTTWTFSPPASPHWGGAWERMVRSVKNSLKVVLKERAPRDEVLSTLMAEVEQIVNSRPLTHVSVEPGTDESLTPNHFLLGSSSNLPKIGQFDEHDLCLRKLWRISQGLADMFWKRWVREILPDMQSRTKWQAEQRSLKVGDLVLIVDPASHRNVWPKGRVQRVIPGKDGRVRVVEVKTQSGLLKRSAARVALILGDDECCGTGVGRVNDT